MTYAADGSPTTRGGRFLLMPIVADTRRWHIARSIDLLVRDERVDMLGSPGTGELENGEPTFLLRLQNERIYMLGIITTKTKQHVHATRTSGGNA